MKTQLTRIKREGVAAAKFYLKDGESFILGVKPNFPETFSDDFQPVKECRFIVKGRTLTENTHNSIELDRESPIPEKANPHWAKITAIGEVVGFCMSTNNPKHRVVKPERWLLTANEELTIKKRAGFLVSATNAMSVNGTEVPEMEIVRLSGKSDVIITASDEGTDVGFLEIQFYE